MRITVWKTLFCLQLNYKFNLIYFHNHFSKIRIAEKHLHKVAKYDCSTITEAGKHTFFYFLPPRNNNAESNKHMQTHRHIQKRVVSITQATINNLVSSN